MKEQRNPEPSTRPRLLFCVTEDWFFVSHFLPMARVAHALGFEVLVATRVGRHGQQLRAMGYNVLEIVEERRSLGLLGLLKTIRAYRSILARDRPLIVHCIALRPVLLGGIAAALAGNRNVILAPTGLGYLWVSDSAKARIIRALVRAFVSGPLNRRGTRFLFENATDPVSLGIVPGGEDRVTIVPGAGVAGGAFPALPPPAGPGPLRVAVICRMVAMKGIADAIAAVTIARAKGADVALDLFGGTDPANPSELTEAQLRDWSTRPGITWHGRSDNVAAAYGQSHVAMLLSWGGEGLPRTLVEAAACGRPIVTTDVPGCRDVVRDGVEGFVVPPKAPEQAAEALMALAHDADLRRRMGEAARARFEIALSEEIVTTRVAALYRAMAEG